MCKRFSANMMWKIAWICLTISLLKPGARGEESFRGINVKSGSDVVLECNVASNKQIELINWRVNNSKTAFFVKFMNFKPFIAERFSGRLHIVNQSTILISRVTPKDSGMYRCRTMVTSSAGSAGVFEQGTPIKLNVQAQHPFFYKLPPERVISVEDSSINLECLVGGIPKPRIEWFRLDNELPLRRTTISPSGWLSINRAEISDAGRYMCSATNVVGTITFEFDIEVKLVPRFTNVPASVETVRVGQTIDLLCSAVSDRGLKVTLSWIRVNGDLPLGRSTVNGGQMTITNIQRDDYGEYACLAKTTESIAKHSTTLRVLATPGAPNITQIERSGKTATITWMPGYDGGYPQTFELWYRKSTDTDFQWKATPRLSSGTTSYKLSELESGVAYRFAVRGINREGAGSFSQPAIRGDNGHPKPVLYVPEKPLPPTNVIVNITSDGYYVSWDHEQVPGRPLVNSFVFEYRKKNISAVWTRADEMVNGDRRVYLLRADLFEPESAYEFRVYAYAKKFSKPAYASKTYVIA